MIRRNRIKNKKAQEEMVGFAMIIIIVAIIVLVLLGISLNKPKSSAVESYEVNSFIESLLQHTTECSMDFGTSYVDVNDMISECNSDSFCDNINSSEERGSSACDVLNSTIKNVLGEAWKTGADRPVKGYNLNITTQNKVILSFNSGNATSNYKAGGQDLTRRGSPYSVVFRVYY